MFDPDFYLDDRLKGENLARALDFLDREYFQKGAALFGRESSESLNDFRLVCGGPLDHVPDAEVYKIILFAVQRRRNYLRIAGNLQSARFKWGKVYNLIDADRFAFCRFMEGKFFRVETASLAIATFVNLPLAEQGSILQHAARRVNDPQTIKSIKLHMEWPDVIPDHLHFEAIGVPPFHRECTCTVFGVDKEEVERR